MADLNIADLAIGDVINYHPEDFPEPWGPTYRVDSFGNGGVHLKDVNNPNQGRFVYEDFHLRGHRRVEQ